jgi:hypothetical protein
VLWRVVAPDTLRVLESVAEPRTLKVLWRVVEPDTLRVLDKAADPRTLKVF